MSALKRDRKTSFPEALSKVIDVFFQVGVRDPLVIDDVKLVGHLRFAIQASENPVNNARADLSFQGQVDV